MEKRMKYLFAVLVLMVSALAARANDSEAEMALGGLTLVESSAVSLDSEDLYVSKDEVRVNYVFTNTSNADVETLVAFPLPDQSYNEESESFYRDFRTELAFETKVDGKSITYDIVEQAFSQGVEITARVKTLGLPLNDRPDTDGFSAKVKSLAEADRKALLDEGLIRGQEYDQGQGMQTYYQPIWTLRMSVTRKQVFPAGKSVRVEHRYKPLIGGSVAGTLEPAYRNQDYGKQYMAQYCVDDSFLKTYDKRLVKGEDGAMRSHSSETWIGYVLKSGANWKGPIKDFRLVVDKGDAKNLVSFCADGVKKISPTQFEVRKKDFEPEKDLNVLIVEWAPG
jgi:hypothetical protein